jgi:hypothetical protein
MFLILLNNSRFISSRRTLGHYPEGASPILHVLMFPWEYFFSMKQERRGDKKRVVYLREVPVLMCSPEVHEHPCAGTSPTTLLQGQ